MGLTRSHLGCAGAIVALAVLAIAAPACADAIVKTQAMQASTIAEYFVEDETVTVELEIGLGDLPAFANLLPDELYEMLDRPAVPLAERLVSFFDEDLTIVADGGEPLPGRVLEMTPRERVVRDDVTGEPLPVPEDEVERVVFVRLEHALPSRPSSITIGGTIARSTGIGFVLYHRSIAVNDFRYLAPALAVRLDWDDPWYSQFEMRPLRRTYFAPMSGFLYVEPYEVRKEIIVRPKDLQHWIDLGLAGRETIPVELQADLKREVAAFLRERQPVEIDGAVIEPELAQINFLERTLRSSRVIDPPVELDLDAAILGVIFVYATESLPERVTLEWDLFNERIAQVPAASVDQAGPLPILLEADFATLEWRNFLTNPEIPSLVAVAAPPTSAMRVAAGLRWPMLVVTVLIGASLLLGGRIEKRLAALALVMMATGICFGVGNRAAVSDERAGTVVGGLLHNIYRAFDEREEERIYDVLDQSVAGDLLTRIYLETRRGLVLANQGGARAKVKEIDVVELSAEPASDGGFLATAAWHVAGSVGHWGHIHERRNQYRARLDVRPVDGAWKLAGMEILEEERVQ
ncbi:MAG: hypothetical protein ACYTGP_06935 [Planctomycetota bacterium]|jgi:hypothetical protein